MPSFTQERRPIDVGGGTQLNSSGLVEVFQNDLLLPQLLPEPAVVVERPQQLGEIPCDRPEFKAGVQCELPLRVDIGQPALTLAPTLEIRIIGFALAPSAPRGSESPTPRC
ncbi:hypothetical protein ACIBL3_00445 [Kribbella sp. NPDC050124]|uniref:hypothetical protein n=1 Tax=Kribbella sp. NPDC050124 TaxID=3364114 RepID=UPI0037B2EB57